MPTMRLRSLLLACFVAPALAAPPASAAAPRNGGAVAPARSVPASEGGGAAVVSRPRKPATRTKNGSRATRRPAPGTGPVEASHVFPVAGAYDLGAKDGRFGAKREGHSHQGQDIAASEGTAVVAPWAGTVEHVRFQRGGAGLYVVLDGDDEDRDYAFMHLRSGSILVQEGQRANAGAPLAQVGNTGASMGPHLHFEVWVGGWYDGGEPVDPLPLLMQWTAATRSPG